MSLTSFSRCRIGRQKKITSNANAIEQGISAQKGMAIKETHGVHNTQILKGRPIE